MNLCPCDSYLLLLGPKGFGSLGQPSFQGHLRPVQVLTYATPADAETACLWSFSRCIRARLGQFFDLYTPGCQCVSLDLCLPTFVLSNFQSLLHLRPCGGSPASVPSRQPLGSKTVCGVSHSNGIVQLFSELCHYVVPGRAHVRRAFLSDPRCRGWPALGCFD